MEKKKIAFVHYQIIVGGISVALLRMIQAIDHEKYDITLFLGCKNGEFEYMIPDYVHIKYHYVENYRRIIKERLKSGQLVALGKAALCRGVESFYRRGGKQKESLYYNTCRYPVCDSTVYDCVVAYNHEQMETVATALFRIKAKKKVLWVHSEFTDKETDFDFLYRRYRGFDKIFCVSDTLMDYFTEIFPRLGCKTEVIRNQIDSDSVVAKAMEECPIQMREHSILTVGHINVNKGSHLIPCTIDLLVKAGYDVYWYLVGDIHDDTLLQSEIKKYGMENRIIFCGLQSNPYPFFRNCEIYVQPSFMEGFGFTVAEAKILCKPIVTTPFKASKEQIHNGINGVIAKEHTSDSLFHAISLFLDNPMFMRECSNELKKESFEVKNDLERMYAVFDGNHEGGET